MGDELRDWYRRHPLFAWCLALSFAVHVGGILALLIHYAWPTHFEEPKETIAVEMVTTSELNQIMNGEEHQKQLDKPQRRVDKVAELEERHPANPTPQATKDTPPPPAPEKPNDDPGHDDKPVPPVAVVPPPPPVPPQRPVEKVETPTPPEKPVEKAETPMPPEKPVDKPPPPDAEAIAPKPPPRPKLEAKKPPKPVKVAKVAQPKPVKVAKVVPPPPPPPVREPPKEEPKTRTFDMVAKLLDKLKPTEPPKKARAGNEATDQPHRDFSFDKITALLDHEAPQHRASTGKQLTQLASLGSPTSHAEKMSPSMMAQLDGWLIDHYRGCWSYFGLGATQEYVPEVRVQMQADGSLAAKPRLLNPPSDPNLRSLADSAMRAVTRCDPLPIPERYKPYYNAWRDRKIRFDPKEMG